MCSQPTEHSVHECIETLYQVFARYRFTSMEGDMGTCDPEPLLTAPLGELPAEAFDRFAWKTMTTWGDADDFRHFLPRMLEILVTEVELGGFTDTVNFNWWLIFGKITYGKWRNWPSCEIQAIENFILARGQQLIYQEYGLDTMVKRYPASQFWLPEPWQPEWDAARSFLTDLDHLEYPEIQEQLRQYWSKELAVVTRLGPFANLAKVYVNECGQKPSELDAWFKQRERVDALYNAWGKYQDQEPLGEFFSDAHANAELICSQ